MTIAQLMSFRSYLTLFTFLWHSPMFAFPILCFDPIDPSTPIAHLHIFPIPLLREIFYRVINIAPGALFISYRPHHCILLD